MKHPKDLKKKNFLFFCFSRCFKKRQQQKVYHPCFAILGNSVSTVSVTNGRTKKYNHVSIIGFVQTGIYRNRTCDISGESYIIRKWQKRVLWGPRILGGWVYNKKY